MARDALYILLILIGSGFGVWGVYMCDRVPVRTAYLVVAPLSWMGALPIAAGFFGLLQ